MSRPMRPSGQTGSHPVLPGGVERATCKRGGVKSSFARRGGTDGVRAWAVVTGRRAAARSSRDEVLAEYDDRAELLYMLDSAVWGKGLATGGARAARDFAFDQLQLRHITALALPENTASMRVMAKIGMVPEPGLVKAFGLDLVRYNMWAV